MLSARNQFAGVADRAPYLFGKLIRVRGEVLMFETRPYLPAADPAQIEPPSPAK